MTPASMIDTRDIPVRFSHLKAYGRSAAHGLLAQLGDDKGQTRAMAFGTKVHVRLLGGELPTPPLVYPGASRRGKEWIKWRDEQEPGARIVTQSEADAELAVDGKVDLVATAIERDKFAHELLTKDVVQEETIFYDWMGRKCRATPDARGQHLTDLKTTVDSGPHRFMWDAKRRSYPSQMALYRQAITLAGLPEPEDTWIVAVESAAPFNVTVLRLPPPVLEIGLRQVRLWFERLLGAEASNSWHGYCQTPIDFEMEDDDIPLDFTGIEGGSQEVGF
jgi:hypothetical protein